MTNYFDKENAVLIRDMNRVLGMKHRSVPYDYANADDLDEALKYAVCAFSDYTRYERLLATIGEEFDESLEHYDAATWINLTVNSEKTDDLSRKALRAINRADAYMYKLRKRAEERCKEVLFAALCSPECLQIRIFGEPVCMSESAANDFIKDFFEKHVDDFEHSYCMPENYSNFVAFVVEAIKAHPESD